MRFRTAFTLLEVLIASALLSTLMLLVWSLFGTFTRLEKRSSRTATEIQLTRSLAQQLRSDVEHLAIPQVWPTPDETLETRADDNQELEQTEVQADIEAITQEGAIEPSAEPIETDLLSPEPTQELASSLKLDFDATTKLDVHELDKPQLFDSSLLETLYFRGSPTKLELVIRHPYTVDIPTGNQLLGSETRYGTHLLVIYEWKDARDLRALLHDDPLLNPKKFTPSQPVSPHQELGDPNRTTSQPVSSPAAQPPAQPILPTRLNPNDNVGLIREAKSWLHVTRDQRRAALHRQVEAAGMLIDGQFPWDVQPNFQKSMSAFEDVRQSTEARDPRQPLWAPPAEFRHKRDHLPEVTRLQFRYFDGQTWQLNWHSDTQLPRAVEVAFDLDPDAPAARAKEFEAAHAAMLEGAALNDVLPPETELPEDQVPDMDRLLDNNLLDPTAIVAEYRFVIRMPGRPKSKQEQTLHGTPTTEKATDAEEAL